MMLAWDNINLDVCYHTSQAPNLPVPTPPPPALAPLAPAPASPIPTAPLGCANPWYHTSLACATSPTVPHTVHPSNITPTGWCNQAWQRCPWTNKHFWQVSCSRTFAPGAKTCACPNRSYSSLKATQHACRTLFTLQCVQNGPSPHDAISALYNDNMLGAGPLLPSK
jgi:hypothetical protein